MKVKLNLTKKKNAQTMALISIILFVVLLFVAALLLMIGNKVGKEFNTKLLAMNDTMGMDASTVEQIESVDAKRAYFDYIFFGFFIALTVGLLVTAYFCKSFPLLFIIFLIMMMISIVLSTIFEESYDNLKAELDTDDYSTQYTDTIFAMLPRLVLILSILTAIIMFGKPRGGGVTY